MARPAKISSGILNIRLHPHSKSIYASFIYDLYRRRKPEQLHGDRYGMISALDRTHTKDGWISGVITTFTNIDKNGRWFDENRMMAASDEQKMQISIPKNLHPNSAAFYFLFDLNKHRIYFQNYSKGKILTVNSALALFIGLSSSPAIAAKYNDAKLTIVQSSLGLAKLFSLKVIREIKITLEKPNADIFADDFEAQIEKHLEETHSRKVVLSYDAEQGRSLVPTKEIKSISEAALDNGSVEVKGRDESGAVSLSTQRFPKIIQDKYDPDGQTEEQAFRALVQTRTE